MLQAVVPVAEHLAWIHLAPRGLLALRLGPAAQPHAQLLTTLVVALKLLYGLDGHSRRLPDGVPPPPPDWMTWAARAIASAPQPSSLAVDAAEVRASVLHWQHSPPAFVVHFSDRCTTDFAGGCLGLLLTQRRLRM